MKETYNSYKIFDFSIKSNILLPELTQSTSPATQLTFSLTTISSGQLQEPIWLHHWLLPNGENSTSFARTDKDLVLRFPNLADFFISKTEPIILCHPTPNTPQETIRHLLLDQVIPRIVNYLGRPVIHASGTVINNSSIIFLGQTGWGKSTLCAFFHQNGFPLLSDDSILLEKKNSGVIGLPSYVGIRLFDDSFKALHFDHSRPTHYIQNVSHYSSKKRIPSCNLRIKQISPVPIKAFFVLNDPKAESNRIPLQFSRITGALAAIELMKHCFHLDPTDTQIMGKQLMTVTDLLASSQLPIFNLNFQRDHNFLPNICKEITTFVSLLS